MTYQVFLKKLVDIDNIDYGFCISKIKKEKLKKYNANNVLNSLAFAPVKYDEKRKIFNMIINGEILSTVHLNNNIENIYNKYSKLYPVKEMAIESYIKYFYDWIEIISDKNIDIKYIKKRVFTKNSLFWFQLIKNFYTKLKFHECLYLIKYVKKEYIKKEHILYQKLSFYELVSLKKGYKYLENKKVQKDICKIVKKITINDYEKIITLFECALFHRDTRKFDNLFHQYEDEILNWSIINILNLYELSIYLDYNSPQEIIHDILHYKDIISYENYKEYKIFKLLESIKSHDIYEIKIYREELNNDFDFSHFEWYIRNKS